MSRSNSSPHLKIVFVRIVTAVWLSLSLPLVSWAAEKPKDETGTPEEAPLPAKNTAEAKPAPPTEAKAAPSWNPEAVSFHNEVMAVLSKTGCNMGACHGAQTGKGELSLSLRGENPAKDYQALLKAFVNLKEPEKSFLLRKPLLEVKHDGGKRFEKDSESYEILRKWVADGAPFDDAPEAPRLASLEVTPLQEVFFAPANEVTLSVKAHFTDGTVKDVNRWAIYEPSTLNLEVSEDGHVASLRPGETTVAVRFLDQQVPARLAFVPDRPDFQWDNPQPFNYIDQHVFAKLKTFRTNPSPLADDSLFVRRVYLDLIGTIPTAEEARGFVKDTHPDKRAKLIDALLQRPEFADFWALKWSDLLRNEEKVLDRNGVAAFHGWIRDCIASGKPLDQFAREILTSRGSTYDEAPSNYYRALREPNLRAEATAQVFLGTRLQCAKCHNHPFEKWTMDDYYQFSAIFDGMDYDIIENKRKDKSDKNMFIGEQVVKLVDDRKFKDPRTEKPPAPRLLNISAPALDPEKDRFEQMAAWLTAPENPLFARVQANRIWAHLMGRGIVDPPDDFRGTNPPSNPALLDALTEDFIASGYDLRHAIRVIANSRTYQLSSTPNETNVEGDLNFARAEIYRVPAEPLLDSLHAALEMPATFAGYDEPLRAAEVPGVQATFRGSGMTPADHFLKLFGKPPRLMNSDIERTNETSLAQVFELTSGENLDQLLNKSGNRLSRLLSSKMSDDEMIEDLYWAVLSRPPQRAEQMAAAYYLHRAEDRRAALEDIAWSVLNSKEFLLRR